MIKGKDVYNILESIVPLYVAMILGYGSVKWWKIFTPDQCVGINRFVALFAIPTLTFIFISPINPYQMNWQLLLADTLQKVVTLVVLSLWNIFTKRGGIDWNITLFSLTNLPNTLVVGIPLLKAMYGKFTTTLLIQILVLQNVLWYNFLLFLHEYRAAKLYFSQQFIETNNIEGSIISHKVDSINVDVEMGEINGNNNNLNVKSYSTSRVQNLGEVEVYSSYSNSPKIDGFEGKILKIQNQRFWRSNSCPDLMVSSFQNLKSTFSWFTNNDQRKEKCSGSLGMPQEEMDASKVSGDKEHESKDGIKNQLTERPKELEIKKRISVDNKQQIPPGRGMMTKLILVRVGRTLSKNPNVHAAILALAWSLISFRWNIKMPAIIHDSVTIMSDTGLGMSMFSLGVFTALQPKIIACSKTELAFSMILKFLVGPVLFGATSAAVGIRGVVFKFGIMQAALPHGIVPFVFAREYNLHAVIFNTSVILGTAIALPIAILYYVLLDLNVSF